MLREFANSSLKVDDDVVQSLSLPVLAMIPMMLTRRDEQRLARRRRLVMLASSIAAAVVAVGVLVILKFRA